MRMFVAQTLSSSPHDCHKMIIINKMVMMMMSMNKNDDEEDEHESRIGGLQVIDPLGQLKVPQYIEEEISFIRQRNFDVVSV